MSNYQHILCAIDLSAENVTVFSHAVGSLINLGLSCSTELVACGGIYSC